ncbi:MAG: DUF4397 domain-containing protein [Anaerolineales bacterium]|nr:DUF4397 domain-containing protein [Anaerolineales bacterium]
MFTVTTAGDYRIESAQDYDGYIHVYANNFDPNDQCVNLVALDDDGGAGSLIETVSLSDGVDYYLVTSGFSNTDVGDFTNVISLLSPAAPLPIPDAAMPVALVPSTGNFPTELNVETRRDASSYTLNDLQALEITDSQVAFAGPALATSFEFSIAEDPTNGNPYDNLDDVFWTTVDVPADTARLVAEIIATTSPDLDLFWGSGDTPSAATELGSSATGTSFEYLTVNDPPAGTYWVLVQNWAGSSAPEDDGVVAVGVVPNVDSGLATFDMPSSQPAGDPFSATLFWDLPDAEVGDVYYGLMAVGTDAGNPDNLGVLDINLYRIEDDVMKMASSDVASPGDTVTYTITVAANTGDTPLTYSLTDTIPAGMTYVAGSVTGGATVTGDTLTWTGDMLPVGGLVYYVTDNVADPTCDTPFGGYVNLEDFSIFVDPSISGDSVTWSYTGRTMDFYDQMDLAQTYTSDGYATFGTEFSTANQSLPDSAVPNNIIAALWRDLEVVLDVGANRGVTGASAGGGATQLVEFDDVQVFGDPSQTLDMNIITLRDADPTLGTADIWFAYNDVNLSSSDGTIGVENADGTLGTSYAYNDVALTDGLVICLDLAPQVGDPMVITYQATVDADVALGTAVTNVVDHEVDAPGTKVEQSEATVNIENASLRVGHLAPFASDGADTADILAGTAVTVTLDGTAVLTDFMFAESTGYLSVPGGAHSVQVWVGSTPVISEEVMLMADMDYTALAIGGANGHAVELMALVDDNSTPTTGFGRVRLGHLAPFASVITDTLADIRTQSGDLVVGPVPYGAIAPYMELPAGEYDLKVTTPGGGTTLIDIAPFTLNDGDVLDAYAIGDGVNQALGVFAYTPDGPGVVLPLAAPELMVSVDGMMVESGVSTVDFMTTTVGSPITKTFTVSNTGSADLMVSDLMITGTGFTTVDFMTTTVAPGEATMFYVVLTADAAGEYDAMVSFSSNDEAAMSFTFDVMGVVTEMPETGYTLYLPLISKP